jgi:ornithine cyclodeaminase/alanine dehydrogenase-like protein (mu-crystallin family)
MLLISDQEVRQVLTLGDCIEAMERAFAEEARGIAVNRPRSRYKVPPDLDKPGYMANIIAGAVPGSGVAALRRISKSNGMPQVSGRLCEVSRPQGGVA